MYKITTTYESFDGPLTETFYFNLNRKEAAEMNNKYGGIEDYIKNIKPNDFNKMVELIEDFLTVSYGIRTEDNKFIKSEEISNEFKNSLAFDQVVIDILSNESAAQEFVLNTLNIKDPELIEEVKNRASQSEPTKTTRARKK